MKKPDINILYQIAENQGGYFTTAQATEAGYYRQRLYDLANSGHFIRVQHGIYRLARFPSSSLEDFYITSLRIGPESVISHESALAVYELSDILPTKIHIIMPRTGSRRREGIQLHTHKLDKDEITEREGLRITTVERTIADVIVYGISYQHVFQAIGEALKRGLTTKKKLKEHAEKRRGQAKNIIYKILADKKL